MTRDDVRALVGARVVVRAGKATETGVLRALTPAGNLLVADSRGFETAVPVASVTAIEDARITCTRCDSLVNNVFVTAGSVECADCHRQWAAQQPVPRETCPDCNQPGAVYSPRYKVWRCPSCHARAGSFTGSSVEASAVRSAVCRSADKDSPLHDWKQFKSQYVCRTCEVKVFGRPAHA